MRKYHVGFTGTQRGLTPGQFRTVKRLLLDLSPTDVHHGDCIGADSQFHDLVEVQGQACIHIHPPSYPKKRAHRVSLSVPRRPAAYMTRNQHIVNESNVLIVCPAERHEVTRSGTWSTYRRAIKAKITIVLVLPSGEVEKLEPQ